MSKTTLERVLHYRDDDGEITRYEIFKSDGSPANNIDHILIYREKLIDGNITWVRTDDKISLDHLGVPSGGFQSTVQLYGRKPRDISSAIDMCTEHWRDTYA